MATDSIQELMDQVDKDFTYDKSNIDKFSMNLGRLYLKYARLLYTNSKAYKERVIQLEELYGKIFYELKYQSDVRHEDSQINKLIKADQRYVTMSIEISKREAIVDYLKGVTDQAGKQNFHVSNFIKLKMIEHNIADVA